MTTLGAVEDLEHLIEEANRTMAEYLGRPLKPRLSTGGAIRAFDALLNSRPDLRKVLEQRSRN